MDGMTGVVEELDNARAHIAALLGVLVEYEAAHDAMRARGDAMVAECCELKSRNARVRAELAQMAGRTQRAEVERDAARAELARVQRVLLSEDGEG